MTLLDAKRSMNINIFLKQFRKTNEEIVDLIGKGDHRAFGVEKIKGLVKLLPQQDEVKALLLVFFFFSLIILVVILQFRFKLKFLSYWTLPQLEL